MVATDSMGSRRSARGPETEMMASLEGGNPILEDENTGRKASTPVSNLELVRKLQDFKAPRSRKIEEAYSFINAQENGLDREEEDKTQDRILMAMPQFVSFLSEWVQSAVLWSSKPQQLNKVNDDPEREEFHRGVPAHLDARYWAILKWCLSSGHLHKFASVSSSLMRPLNLYVFAITETVGSLSDSDLDNPMKVRSSAALTEESVQSVEVLLLANERSFRPDLDHWVSLASTALSKLAKLKELNSNGRMKSPVTRLIVCILEGFARFVAIHPNRRKIFTSVTENLLESLLIAHGTVRKQCPQVSLNSLQSSSGLHKLLQSIDGILEKGLFHAAHVGSFQDVCTVLSGKGDLDIVPGSTEKKRKRTNSSRDRNENGEEEDKDVHLSYHRLLFKKLDSFRRSGLKGALMEQGWIFETYAKSFKSHQAAEDIDVFGIRSKGKPQPEGEERGKVMHDAQLVDKKDRSSEALFNVFAEFIGPFVKDLESFHLSLMSHDADPSRQQIVSAKVSMIAVAGLLKAAKTENIYVPTEDSTTQANLSFLRSCFNTLVGIGVSLPSLLGSTGAKAVKKIRLESPTENMEEHKLQGLFSEILREIIMALKYLIELDYKVVENSLGDMWAILLAEEALQQVSQRDHLCVDSALIHMKQEAIEVACHIINIFSDLRQVDQVLFSLCVTLRRFMSQGSGIPHTGKQSTPENTAAACIVEEPSWLTVLNAEAIELLVCAEPLLLAISSAMQALPEGQVAEFLRLLTEDALESISVVDTSGEFNQKLGPGSGRSGKECVTVGLKGLVELYCCMLENVKIIGSNSIQAGKAVRQLAMQIVTPKLVQLIDFFTLSPNGEDSLLNTWTFVFLLRLYNITQSLHRECISLMPPKAAKKACAALDGPLIDYLSGDITDILTYLGTASYFSGVGRGAVKVSHFLAGIEKRIDAQELVDSHALGYSFDCIAIQSLAQISRHIEAANFLVGRCQEVKTVMPGVEARLQKLLKDLKKESQKLAKFLLKGVAVEASFIVDTLPRQRWNLVCKSFDIWSKFAAEEDLRKFVVCLLSASLVAPSMKIASEEQNSSHEEQKRQITDDLLCNALFYEEESLRRIFPLTFREELQKSSLSAFGKWPFDSNASNPFPEIDSVKGKPPSNQSENKRSGSHLNALDRCVGLMYHLSALPAGYIELSECAPCAYTLLCFERLLMSSLLDMKAAATGSSSASGSEERVGISTVFKLLNALSTCRSALVALTSSDSLNVSNPKLMAVLAGSFASIQWLSSSVHEAMICLVDFLKRSELSNQERKDLMSSGKSLLYAVLTSTTSIVTYLSEQTFMAETSISPTIDPKGGFRIEVIDYQVKMVDQLVRSRFGSEQSERDGCDEIPGFGHNFKDCFQCLALSSFLSSHFWGLRKFSEEFVKDGSFQSNPSVWPIPSIGHAQKLGVVLTETLLSAIVPADSHAVLLDEEGEGKHGSATAGTDVSYTAKGNLQTPLLENMLQESCSNKSEIIGELYLAMAGILKLESINYGVSADSSDKSNHFQEGLPPAMNLLMGAGYWLLMKAADDSQPGHWSHLGWLIGVVKYMEAIYCLTPSMKPPLPPVAFTKLFNMHIHLLGSLSPSEEQYSRLKSSHPLDFENQQGTTIGQGTEGNGTHTKETKSASPHSLRTAVRESLGTLLRTASRQNSVLALQSIMRALVGVLDSNRSSGLEICGPEDGKVGRGVAAGIECLSIALEAVSGTKRLRLLANHFHEFFGAIFNIMEYVQGPHLFLALDLTLFHGDSIEGEFVCSRLGGMTVESGPVILQALQILVTTASRDTIFPMKACHVALALHCPARLFWPVYRCGLSKFKSIQSQSSRWGQGKESQSQVTSVVRIGTELGVKLYVSCCRLLCSVIRHHNRESGHCIALLGDSARVLLHCLEAPNWPSSDVGGAKDWGTKMAAYCASWLRRIYEEMGEHKETLGKYCSHVLSDYLSVLSGHGLHAAGLIREVEAALQPGAYVLVDACSASDLQQLHASLGEGPRRNALLNLRRQYQQQFKYTGKV
ncbi:unnamed protein product [Calypogeia fissa]